jgi:hypothetical protein
MPAGHVMGEVLGSTWEDLVRQRLLESLDTRHSHFDIAGWRHGPTSPRPCPAGW